MAQPHKHKDGRKIPSAHTKAEWAQQPVCNFRVVEIGSEIKEAQNKQATKTSLIGKCWVQV